MGTATPRKIVVIGGVAGGASAAAKARRTDEHAEITVLERGPYVSFANCGLPYFIGDTIPDRADLLLQTPDSLWKRFRIRVLVRHEALRINRSEKRVEVRNLSDGTVFQLPYDKLVLSPGAAAIVPDLAGLPASNVFTVKTVPDAEGVKAWISQHTPKRAVVVGAGFIGMETAEALLGRGLDVTVVEMLPQVLPPFDADVAQWVLEHVQSNGLEVILGDGIKGLVGKPAATGVLLQSGRELPADLVILSIGVRPELKLAKEAGLTIGPSGGLAVNARQQTSDPNIYAAGDAVEVLHLVSHRPTRIPLAGPANKQGRVAGANAAGGDLTFPGALGTAIVECLGITAAKTGLSEREAEKEGIAAFATWTHPLEHAGYYPGAAQLHIKLVTEHGTGRLLGAQVVGGHGVDKRIDVLATALHAGLNVSDLEDLDLAYAPQFSSAKDPVVMAGFVAANAVRGDAPSVTWGELEASWPEDLQVVDVRTPKEFETGFLPRALNIPIDELRERLGELHPDKETVVYCRVGFRGYLATTLLRQHGFGHVRNLSGGILSTPARARHSPEKVMPRAPKVIALGEAPLRLRENFEASH